MTDMKLMVFEIVKNKYTLYRKEREKDMIRLFDVYNNSLNREDLYDCKKLFFCFSVKI